MSLSKNRNTPIEKTLFKIAVIMAVSVTGFWLIFGAIIGYEWPVMTIYGLAFVFYSFILLYVIKGNHKPIILNAYFYFGALMLALGWFPSGGMRGAVMHLFVMLYFAGLLTLAPRGYLIFVFIMITMVLSFTVTELNYPDLAAPYLDEMQRITDISIGNILIMIVSGAAVFIFKRAYLRDQIRIQKLNITLEQEKIKAETADQTKSQFLATVSHEMRTPLSGIIGITDLLMKTKLSDEQKQLVVNLTNSSSLLHSLISDVLDLSEIESGELVLHESSFDLKEEIEKILEIFRAGIKGVDKLLTISYHHDAKINYPVKGDLLRIKQIIINLVNNAVKFTDHGFVKVSSYYLDGEDDIAKIRISIEDTGKGIPAEKQKQLFDKFYKADATQDAEVQGTGLGLSISKNLVELMNGTIYFESEVGKGSIFTFEIPFKKAGLEIQTNDSKHETTGHNYTNLKVLLVEDASINQMVINKMLKNLNISRITLAENGLEGVKLATSEEFDLILMDVQMPEMDGLEASEKIISFHSLHGKKPPLIFALTANAMKEDIEKCINAGMSHFISKPFTQSALEQAIDNYASELL